MRKSTRCFNSLQVSYKLHSMNKSLYTFSSFNSLQVSYKLVYKVDFLFSVQFGFNSLQVSYKPIVNQPSGTIAILFQFLIGQLQTDNKSAYKLPHHYGFNSLQVSYKPFRRFKLRCFCFCFNSLQVSYKHLSDRTYKSADRKFQFLIGQLQT